jgi:hypothetical protein
MSVTNEIEFKRYCLRSLGAPVVSVDVTDEQIDDRVGEGLKKFNEYHYSGTLRTYVKHQITLQDISNKYIPVDNTITGVVRVLSFTDSTNANGSPFSVQYQLRMNDIWDTGNSGLVYYTQSREYLTMLDQILNGTPTFRFNRVQDRVYIDTNWGNSLKEGDWVVVEAYMALSPADFPQIWEEPWLKKYCTALIKRQWGNNLKKFSGIQLVGGVVIDGQELYEEALQEIEQLEEELRDTYEEPPLFFMG